MSIGTPVTTVEEFEIFVDLPENADRNFEFIGGEIVEVPSNPYSSFVSSVILTLIMNFVLKHKLGFVTGEGGGYQVAGERYAPDVAFVSKEKQKELPKKGYNPYPPDLAVEVLSSTDKTEEKQLRIKTANYQYTGTVVWIVNPETKTVEVYTPGQPVKIVGADGTLEGGNVLPGLMISVKDIFVEME